MKLKDEKEIICKHKLEEKTQSFQYAELSFLPLKIK